MKRLLPLLALVVMMSACVKPNDNDEPTEIKFSVLGDSFSAFADWVDPETNDVFHYDQIGVTEPEQMWWYQVAVDMGWTLEKNNSFSGSLVSNFDDFHGGSYYEPNSYLNRMDNLGGPDVIMVFGATNDIYQRAPVGNYVYSDWSEEQLHSFRPAMAYLIDNLKQLYPKAEVYVLVDMELCINDGTIEEETREAYIESMHRIASHYGVNCIDIYDIHKSAWHPNKKGQEDIARQVVEALTLDFNV